MGVVRIAILATAAVAAIVLAFIVRGMTSGDAAAPAPVAMAEAAPVTKVLVAKQDLPVGTRISPTMIGWQDWPAEAVSAAYITDGARPAPPAEGAEKVAEKAEEAAKVVLGGSEAIQALDGAVVREAMLAGEPIIARKVLRGGEGGFLSVVLAPGMRAVAVPITAETASGGFILPGDRVDVIHSREAPDGSTWASETLLRNLRVLAIDQSAEPKDDANTMIGAVATLETAAPDAEVLARALADGEITLALRAYTDINGPTGRGGGVEAQTVRIYRDGEITEVSVR